MALTEIILDIVNLCSYFRKLLDIFGSMFKGQH